MKFKGIITAICRDANTLEVLGQTEQHNIITESFGADIFPGYKSNKPNFDLTICLSTGVYEPSYYAPVIRPSSSGFTTVSRSGDVFGVLDKTFIEVDDGGPDIIQFSARFNPPAAGTTRTIMTVLLSDRIHAITNNFSALALFNKAYAYSKLDVPCVQTDSQIYDIYYRILVSYDEDSSFSKEEMRTFIKRASLKPGKGYFSDGFLNHGYYKMLPSLNVPASDKNTVFELCTVGDISYTVSSNTVNYNIPYLRNYKNVFFNQDPRPYGIKEHTLDFNNYVGLVLNEQQYYYNVSATSPYPITHKSNKIFDKQSKIQNIFGYNIVSNNVNSHPFLDVDNLPIGTGAIGLSGDWENIEPHTDDSLYFKTKFPERNTITITNTGAVGVSAYKYVKEKYLPILPNGGNPDQPTNKPHSNMQPTLPLTQLIALSNPGAINKGVLGDASDTFMDIEQISSSIAFDDSSFLIPKKDKVILYSLAGSRYWNITGLFTNIHQIEVFDGLVYIACRATGLYVCDPTVSLAATKVEISSPRVVDLSKCHGVSLGYNKLWVVANDALCSYDGTQWSIFDNSTTSAFGTVPTIFESIGYLKCAQDSSDDQIFFVYLNAPTTKIGFWWSPSTTIVELALTVGAPSHGLPKRNRQHVKVCKDFAYIFTFQRLYRCPFGLTTSTELISSYIGRWMNFDLIDNSTKTEKLLALYLPGAYSNGTNPSWYNVNVRVYDKTFTQLNSIESAFMFVSVSNYFGIGSVNIAGFEDVHKTTINVGGVWVIISKPRTNEVYFNIGKPPYITPTQNGGPYAYLVRETYGWNGTEWVIDEADSKPTHLGSEPLLDGIEISFANGLTGTSFVSGNHYKFGLCEGLLKDNATRARHVTPEILVKSVKGIATLSSNTVPALATLTDGVVQMHATHKSKNAYLDVNGRVRFPGNTDGQFAVGDKQVTGDFHLTISCADIADPLIINRTVFGIGKRHKGSQPLIGIVFTSSTSASVWKNPRCIGNNTSSGTAEGTNIYNINSLNSSSVIGIKRVGTTITITLNGNNVHTVVTTGLINNNDKRLDVVFSTFAFILGNAYRIDDSVCPVLTIAQNGSDNAVFVGDSVLETEAYDIRCRRIVPELEINATLDGVYAPVKIDGSLPVPGEVSVDFESLLLIFNEADEGKAISIDCTRVWDM